MLALFSLILVLVGCANWLCIGLLQFDFVAGLFGSQSNIFSRIVYVIVGVAAIVLTINIIKNKGRIGFDFKKMGENKQHKPAVQMEASHDNSKYNSPINNFQAHNSQHNQHNTMQQSQQKEMKNISAQLSAKHNEHRNNQ